MFNYPVSFAPKPRRRRRPTSRFLSPAIIIATLVAVLSTTGVALAMGEDHEPVPEPGGNVYLIVGQSNAAGRGDLPNELVPYPGVTVWNGSNFVPGTPNLNQFSTVARRTAEYNIGYTFGGSMSQATGQDIRLVVNARGGSSIVNWLPDGAVEPDSGLQLFDLSLIHI